CPSQSSALRRLQNVRRRLEGGRPGLLVAVHGPARYHRKYHAARLRAEYTGLVNQRCATRDRIHPAASETPLGALFMKRYWFGISPFAFLCAPFAWAQTPSEFKAHDGLTPSVAISSDGKSLATAGIDGLVRIWDFSSGKESQVLKGHTGTVST